MKDLIIYGCGSLGRVLEQIVLDINKDKKQFNMLGFVDDDEGKHGTQVVEYPVLGGHEVLGRHTGVTLTIAFSNSRQRKECSRRLRVLGYKDFATLVHPLAWVSRRVAIGQGSVVYPGVHIDVDVIIGRHNIFNKLCTIGHDSFFEDFVTAAPAVNFGGNIHIGEGCDFGINSATVQGISVGKWSTIGAGSIVTKDLPGSCTAVGVPARVVGSVEEERA